MAAYIVLAYGSIVLGWLYESSGGSVLTVAVWHGTYNLTAATAAAHGTVAAVVSMGVMIGALALVSAYRQGLPTPVDPIRPVAGSRSPGPFREDLRLCRALLNSRHAGTNQ